MEMIIRFFATLRNISGFSEINLPVPRDIKTLLVELTDRYGKAFSREIWLERDGKRDSLIPGVIILVNGRHYVHLDGLETQLEEKDVISLFPPVAGG